MRERLEPKHQRRQDELRSRIRKLEAAREKLRGDNEPLQSTIRELNESIQRDHDVILKLTVGPRPIVDDPEARQPWASPEAPGSRERS